jgi:predicted XRE-type DNA-binding protein
MSNDNSVRSGGRNVFANLGLPDADDRLLKARFAVVIDNTIAHRGFGPAAAAKRLGITQAHVSDLHRGRLRGFSVEKLLCFARALGMRWPYFDVKELTEWFAGALTPVCVKRLTYAIIREPQYPSRPTLYDRLKGIEAAVKLLQDELTDPVMHALLLNGGDIMDNVKLPRFRGHRTIWVRGVHDGQDKSSLPA